MTAPRLRRRPLAAALGLSLWAALVLATAPAFARADEAVPAEAAHGEATHGEAAAGEAGHGEAAHGEGEHGGSLSEVMLHHVTDGSELELPGICRGGFHFDCKIDLKAAFGDALVFKVGGGTLDMTPTRHLVMMWIATAILLLVVLTAARRRDLVPRGLYNFVELLVQFVRVEIARKNIGERDGDRFVPYLATAFFFILFVNLFGLVPWAATATGNVAVTLALAALTFLVTQYAAIRAQGLGGWLKHLTGGVHPLLWPIMIPVEVMGLFTKPFALTIRLFANMVAGHIVILSLIGLIFALGSPFVAVGSVPMALAIFMLEIFVSFVQAYIFTMLSSLFIGQGLAQHGHGEEDHGAAEPGAGHVAHQGHPPSHAAGHAPGRG